MALPGHWTVGPTWTFNDETSKNCFISPRMKPFHKIFSWLVCLPHGHSCVTQVWTVTRWRGYHSRYADTTPRRHKSRTICRHKHMGIPPIFMWIIVEWSKLWLSSACPTGILAEALLKFISCSRSIFIPSSSGTRSGKRISGWFVTVLLATFF